MCHYNIDLLEWQVKVAFQFKYNCCSSNSYRNPSEARRTSFVMKTKVNRNTIHNIQRAKLRLVRYWKLNFFVYRKEDVFVNILMYLTTLKNKYFLAKIKSEIWSDIFWTTKKSLLTEVTQFLPKNHETSYIFSFLENSRDWTYFSSEKWMTNFSRFLDLENLEKQPYLWYSLSNVLY